MDNVSKGKENSYRSRKFELNFWASVAIQVVTIRKHDDIFNPVLDQVVLLADGFIQILSSGSKQINEQTNKHTYSRIMKWTLGLLQIYWLEYIYVPDVLLFNRSTMERLFLFDNWPRKSSICKNNMVLTHHHRSMCLWVFSGLMSDWHFPILLTLILQYSYHTSCQG